MWVLLVFLTVVIVALKVLNYDMPAQPVIVYPNQACRDSIVNRYQAEARSVAASKAAAALRATADEKGCEVIDILRVCWTDDPVSFHG